MKSFSYILALLFAFFHSFVMFAGDVPSDVGFGGDYPTGTIVSEPMTIIGVLSLIQSILLKVVLPIVLIGSMLYIAYELFTAEGDETKMKKAWKSVAFSAIGLICIAVSYAFVEVLSTLSL